MPEGRVGYSPGFQFSWKGMTAQEARQYEVQGDYAKPKEGLAPCTAVQ